MISVAVTARAFSNSVVLRKELLKRYPDAKFNEEGTQLSGVDLISYLQGCEKAIIALEIIDDKILSALPKLKVISKFGVGLDNLDLPAFTRRKINLGWAPGVNKRSVSELALSFMLALSRNVFKTSHQLKQGVWNKSGGHNLSNKIIGLIGVGHIAKDLIQLLKPFGCKILVNDIVDQSAFYKQQGVKEVSFDQLITQSDIVSLHVSKTSKTVNMINEHVLKKMKSSAYLINTSRGDVVDQNALKQALIKEEIAGAAVDVYHDEACIDESFLQLPNLIATPHIGGNAYEAVLAMGRAAIVGLDNVVNINNLQGKY